MLGEGGMGAVYRAEDLTLGRAVALKFLPAKTAADPQARKRLLKEAQAASRLNHPNIATIYEVNATEAVPFISMELVTGQTLKHTLVPAAQPPAQFLSIARQIAEGLQEAHRSGVCHRDIKPANIMIDSRARVKILDFGLAELAHRERVPGEAEETSTTRTSRDSTGGTVPYMSPEQLRGEPADARSDIFSFGVLLYECLAGRLPFQGETSVDILYAILRAPYTPLRTLVPQIDPEWEKLIDCCLAKSPAQRCASMDEILQALDRIDARTRALPQQSEKSIAALYFANLSENKEDEYFRDGMTEDIITELTKIRELQLLPRSAVLAYRDKSLPVSQVGQQLDVAYVLDGSLRRSGNRLRITAQLAETRTGRSVWAERYDRQLEDVFAIQDEIAQNIARALRVVLSDTEKRAIEKVPTRDIQAYDYYLRGRQAFFSLRRKGIEFARQMFARAIVIDPAYAAAFAGVANCCSFLYMFFEATQDNLREAMTASRRAVELDPESAEAHAARGLAEVFSKSYDQAEREFEEAIRLNPRLFEAFYFYGRALFAQGRMEEAAALFRKASELDPADYQSIVQLENCLRSLGREDEARQAGEQAMQVIERHIQHEPGDVRAFYLGGGTALLLGDRERALDWTARALAIDPEETAVLYNVACTYSQLGETDKALDLLEKAIRNGFGYKEWLEHDPDLNPIRDHPRFHTLLQSLSSKRTESYP